MRTFGEGDIKEFGRLIVEFKEETIAIPRDRSFLQAEKRDRHRIHSVYIVYGESESVMIAQMLEVSLLAVRTVLHVEGMRGQW